MVLNTPQPLPKLPATQNIVPLTQHFNDEHRKLWNRIIKRVDTSTARFENVLRPIADLENQQSGERLVIAALKYAAPDIATQRAVEAAENLNAQYTTEIDERTDCFDLLQAVKQRNEPLDGESKKLLDRRLLRYTRCGHGKLDRDGIDQWHKTNNEIENLCTEFNRNIREYDAGYVYFTDHELKGLPDIQVKNYRSTEDGKREISVRASEMLSILKQVDVPSTREQMQTVWGQRLQQNAVIFRRVMELRDDNARLMGLKSHAESILFNRLAPSAEWIDNLLEDLATSMLPAGKELFGLAQAKKTEDLANESRLSLQLNEDAALQPWDISYYNHKLELDANVDHSKIMEYFPLEQTCKSMLQLFGSYLQLRFDPIPRQELVGHLWADDIQVWSVWEDRQERKDFVGYLYADLLDRPYKFRGNQAVNLQPGYVTPNGDRVYPVSTIMCHMETSMVDGCRLLKHRQVQTLFHELGHCMHDLLARTKYAEFHGYEACTEFVESISTMLENWVWIKDVLQTLSCHYTQLDPKLQQSWIAANPDSPLPPAKIPDDLVDSLVKTRRSTRLSQHLLQLSESTFDMAVHNPPSYQALMELDENKLYRELQCRFLFAERPELGYLNTCFNHLMSGMDAGYYGYLCANMYAEELFQEAFARDHASKESWERFRYGILEFGGSRNELGLLEGFLGRKATPAALLRRLDIIS